MTYKNLVINVHKTKGMTSHDVVTAVKRIFSAKKAGHAGTLDPMATGVLLVCLDEATKITRFLSDTEKEYVAVMKLGERTDTLDAEGTVIQKTENFTVDEKKITDILETFKGRQEQIPPMYSAIKVSGQPLYKLARKGLDVERQPRQININGLYMVSLKTPYLEIGAACSKGTYIRSLCDDIGMALGMGAHVTELKRIRVGNFSIDDSALLEELPLKEQALCSIDEALRDFREIILTGQDFHRAINGARIAPEALCALADEELVRLKNPGKELFAIGRYTGATVKIERLLNVVSGTIKTTNS